MARKSDDASRMRDMIDFACKALRFGQGKSRDDLDRDEVLCLALVRVIEMIGEAASRVTQDTRGRHAEIPWAQIVGMRNRLIHGYDQVDLDLLWQTIQQDLQPLIDQLEKIVSSEQSDSLINDADA